MGEVIEFRPKSDVAEESDIDPITAIDIAIRDLRDIAENWGDESARVQAEECRRMLERAFAAAYF